MLEAKKIKQGAQTKGFDDALPRASTKTDKSPWSATLPEQMAAIAQTLADAGIPLTEPDLAARFTGKGPWKKRLPEILQTLMALGRARQQNDAWLVR